MVSVTQSVPAIVRIRRDYVAVALKWTWWNQQRKMPEGLRSQMARSIQAEETSVGASKTVYHPKMHVITAVNAVRTAVRTAVEALTLPGHMAGLRLLPRADLPSLESYLAWAKVKLADAARAVQDERSTIMGDAKARLGPAYDPDDYPADLAALYTLTWSYPAIAVDEELPADVAVRQEEALAAEMEAVGERAELLLLEDLQDQLAHMKDRLTPGPDGSRKRFEAGTLTKLQDIFGRCSRLSILQTPFLLRTAEECAAIFDGITASELREDEGVRNLVLTGLGVLLERRPGCTSPILPGTGVGYKANIVC